MFLVSEIRQSKVQSLTKGHYYDGDTNSYAKIFKYSTAFLKGRGEKASSEGENDGYIHPGD